MILLSFWTERYFRLSLIAVSLFVLFTMHLVFADHAPSDYVPTISKIRKKLSFLIFLQ